MKITMPVSITASDAESRIIAGRIVQWDAEGNTSAGRTKFLPNSINFGKNTKLVLEHNKTKPLGKLVEWSQDDTGITASFRIAKTNAGNDALEEAATGLRSDFSVGVEVDAWENKDGVMAISASNLIEVSLVTDGAIPGAEVEKVAATETPGTAATESTPEPQIEEPKTEGDDLVSETVSEAVSTETVEAAKAEVKATSHPLNSQRVRTPIVSAGSYLEHSVRASLGDETSKLYVAAASDTTSTEVAGLVPTPQLTTIWDPKTTNIRPAISAVRNAALPAAGLTFEIPRVKTAPTVAEVAEKGAFSDTQVEIEYVSCSVKKYAGMQKFDVEVLDRTSPAFFDELVRLMASAYAKATDEAMLTAIQGGTLDSTTITLPFDGDEFAGFISRGAASIYNATKRFPTGILVSPAQWANLIALTDGQKRPLFNVAGNSQNGMGVVEPGSAVGSVMGLPVYVDPYQGTTGDDTIVMVNSEAFTWYESAAPLQLRTNIVGTGQVEVGYYGYGSAVTLSAGGSFGFNNAV
jgi:HK97 family phage prohead protease/HK97 family phage major capsid protein